MNTAAIIIIILSIAIILYITFRKFPVLAVLDVQNIQGEREAKFKERIIRERFQRKIAKNSSGLVNALQKIDKKVSKFFTSIYEDLQKLKEDYRVKNIPEKSKAERIKILLNDAEELKKEDKYNEVEKKLIEVIKIDENNLDAFTELGYVYYKLKKYEEARQTFSFALKLLENVEDKARGVEIHFILSLVNKGRDDIDQAIKDAQKALKIVPNNPRYLDRLLGFCIEKKDKSLALEIFKNLEEINPDNQKLVEFKESIDNL